MKLLLKSVCLVIYLVGCYELLKLSFWLLTSPSDLTFTAGILILTVLAVLNAEIIVHLILSWAKGKDEDDDEETDASPSDGSSTPGGLH